MTEVAPSQRLLHCLADGHFHSGQTLATAMGVSRAAVWKQVRRLQQEFGVAIHAVRGRGYRLAAPLELLDLERIREHIGEPSRARLEGIELLTCTPSTNSCAAADPPTQSGYARAWLAEHQTAGRGRRGRDWVSVFGHNIYLSLAWRFDLAMSELSALSLAVGVIVAETLRDLGVSGHALKWPNDLLADGRKLAGILVEVSGEAAGPATAVVGVGLNMRLPASSADSIDQPWTDLDALHGGGVSRNALAGKLIDRLVDACDLFAREGITPYRDRWLAFDAYHGRPVTLHSGGRVLEGIYAGIAANGALILDDGAGRSEHHAGEISLRAQGDT